ncbi:MAG: DinB family protein [Phycisphaerales bacterium]
MDASRIIGRLANGATTLRAVASIATTDDARWKPAPEHWSILEICCHLLDEEREDFRVRIKSTLEDPTRAWPTLQLDQVAEKRGYAQRDLASTLDEFVRERAASVEWLRSLRSPDWTAAYVHPKFGPLSAGMLLASWAAHDALHMRQIAKRLHGLAARDGAPYSIAYAGDWTA